MPRATVNIEDTTSVQLKSLSGGEVVLRRMSYGQIMQRRAMMKLSLTQTAGRKSSLSGEMALASKEIALFELRCCIVDHNLTDENEKPLDLSNPRDVDRLNPKVGQELDQLISDMNNFEDEDEDPNSKPV